MRGNLGGRSKRDKQDWKRSKKGKDEEKIRALEQLMRWYIGNRGIV